jgi:predicted XRE-type DNA-binding protein
MHDRITRGSGNVYADLGIELSPEEEVKIAIAAEITRVITARGYTQSEAAAIIGAHQSKVSRISRGLISGFSAERLMFYLLKLGMNVDIRTSESECRVGRLVVTPAVAVAG